METEIIGSSIGKEISAAENIEIRAENIEIKAVDGRINATNLEIDPNGEGRINATYLEIDPNEEGKIMGKRETLIGKRRETQLKEITAIKRNPKSKERNIGLKSLYCANNLKQNAINNFYFIREIHTENDNRDFQGNSTVDVNNKDNLSNINHLVEKEKNVMDIKDFKNKYLGGFTSYNNYFIIMK